MAKGLMDDELWSLIEPLLPTHAPRNRRYAGRKPTPDRAVLSGIVLVLRSGIAWNLLPQEMGCGSGTACWRRLLAWQEAGVWQRICRKKRAEEAFIAEFSNFRSITAQLVFEEIGNRLSQRGHEFRVELPAIRLYGPTDAFNNM